MIAFARAVRQPPNGREERLFGGYGFGNALQGKPGLAAGAAVTVYMQVVFVLHDNHLFIA